MTHLLHLSALVSTPLVYPYRTGKTMIGELGFV